MSNASGPIENLAEIQGIHYPVFEVAVGELRRHGGELEQRELVSSRDGDSYVVAFYDLPRPPCEASAEQPAFVVTMRAVDLQVMQVQTAHAKPPQTPVLDRIAGSAYPAVERAVALFREKKLELAHYLIALLREGETIVAIFTGKDAQPGERGSFGKHIGFEVEMDGRTHEPTKSRFVR